MGPNGGGVTMDSGVTTVSGINADNLNTERPTLVFFLGPTKPLQSDGLASPHRRLQC
jgi:hypothetical protein